MKLLIVGVCFALVSSGLCVAQEDPREKAAREAVNGRPDNAISAEGNSTINADRIKKSVGKHRGSGSVSTLEGYSESRYRNYNFLAQEQAARESEQERRRQIYSDQQNPSGGAPYSGPRGRAAVDAFQDDRVKEQTRRCANERGSLTRGGGAECDTLKSLQSGITGIPPAPEIKVENRNTVIQQAPRTQFCRDVGGGNIVCN